MSKFAIALIYFYCSVIILNAQITENKMEMVIQKGHTQYVRALAVNNEGSFFATAGDDGLVKIWNAEGILIRNILTTAGSLGFCPDGKTLYTIGTETGLNFWLRDNGFKFWNIEDGKLIRSLTIKNPDGTNWTSIAAGPDAKLIATGSNKGNLYLWDNFGKLLKTIPKAHVSEIREIYFSPDGKKIITNCWADNIKIRDISGNLLKELNGTDHSSLTISPNWDKIASCDFNKIIKIWNIDGTPIASCEPLRSQIQDLAFSFNGEIISSFDDSYENRDWDMQGKDIKKSDPKYSDERNKAVWFPDGKAFITLRENAINIWNSAGILKKKIKDRKRDFDVLTFSPDGSLLAAAANDGLVWKTDGKLLFSLKEPYGGIAFSPDGKNVITGSYEKCVKQYGMDGKLIKKFEGFDNGYFEVRYSPDGSVVAAKTNSNDLRFWDNNGNRIELSNYYMLPKGPHFVFTSNSKAVMGPGEVTPIVDTEPAIAVCGIDGVPVRYFKIGKNGLNAAKMIDQIASGADGNLVVCSFKDYRTDTYTSIKAVNTENGNIKRFGKEDKINCLAVSNDSKLIASGSADIKLWDYDGNPVKTLKNGNADVEAVSFSPDGKLLAAGSEDGRISLWNLQDYSSISLAEKDGEWIIYSSDGYYDCSANGGGIVSMVNGTSVYGIDQFAVKNNRPDIILQRLGSTDTELLEHYYQHYQKRLRKLGLTEDQLTSELHVPVSSIIDSKAEGKFINLNFSLSDSKYQLKRYNISVNDVPLFGSYGKDISGSTLNLSENIELISGTNKIEISCMNDKGVESFRALTYADYEVEGKGDLYYLAFGVSQYKDSSLNLKYADKDAGDLSEAFSKLNASQFNNVYSKTFTNEQVTLESIRSAKDFLKKSKPDDTFILFIAGHGVHDTDKEATYYYLTHETDLNNLSGTAANFELIEDILQGIPPRNKLFLMDTCESGEIEDGVQNTYYASADSRGLKGRGIKVTEKVTSEPVKTDKRTYLFEKDRYIYNDLARRSGAIVFSSSKGGEFSYEKDDIQNGLFTEEIIKCLASKEADKDNNGTISTDELRDYVSKAVAASSGDLQHPTVDRDNIYQKFGFGIVK